MCPRRRDDSAEKELAPEVASAEFVASEQATTAAPPVSSAGSGAQDWSWCVLNTIPDIVAFQCDVESLAIRDVSRAAGALFGDEETLAGCNVLTLLSQPARAAWVETRIARNQEIAVTSGAVGVHTLGRLSFFDMLGRTFKSPVSVTHIPGDVAPNKEGSLIIVLGKDEAMHQALGADADSIKCNSSNSSGTATTTCEMPAGTSSARSTLSSLPKL
jgi:hypothetical protein